MLHYWGKIRSIILQKRKGLVNVEFCAEEEMGMDRLKIDIYFRSQILSM